MTNDSGTMRRVLLALLGALGAAAALAPAASANELVSQSVSAAGAIDGSCTTKPLDGPGVVTRRLTSPSLGEITARLSGGRGDWDLAIFSASSDATVAGSAYSGSDEVAGGYAFDGEHLIVQACALPGASGSPKLSVDLIPILQKTAGPAPSLLRVETPDGAAREALQATSLDVTESVGPGYTDVIAYGAADRAVLAELGLPFVTRVSDLTKVSRGERRREASAARTAASAQGFPSGRTGTYRRLFDYSEEMKALVKKHPKLVRMFTLPFKTYEGRQVQGIEISRHVHRRNDGKPTFMQLGVHHAREWPSGEHALEWAYELIKGYENGEKRAKRLVKRSRTIIVPIVNPDGFNASREAGEVQGAAGGRDGDSTQEIANIVSHPNEYRRKNCRFADGSDGGSCVQPAFGLAAIGVDPNRNYGGFWGGPGASTDMTAEDYRGPGPFSEPETQNIRSLVSRRQVTAFITNHTFTGLVLRPPGIASQGPPVDERILARQGKRMAAENGYVNQPAYGLYDTTGSTEDWAYYTTGSLGYTFEIGSTNFHPSYSRTVAEWNGTTQRAGKGGGNRAAYYHLASFVLEKRSHSILRGKAPRGGKVIIRKSFMTPTSPVLDSSGEPGKVIRFRDKLRSSVDVKRNGRFKFNMNPSTRPLVAQRSGRTATGPPSEPLQFNGTAATATPCADAETKDASCYNDHPIKIPNDPGRDNDSANVEIEWNTAGSDWDMKVFRDSNGDGKSAGEKQEIGTSATGTTSREGVTITNVKAGERYVARVVNFLATEPYDGTVTFEGPTPKIKPKRERWNVICKNRKGKRIGSRRLYIERGQVKRVNLRGDC